MGTLLSAQPRSKELLGQHRQTAWKGPFSYWEEVYSPTKERKPAEYFKALDEIEIERRARFLDGAREEYWRRNGRDIERVTDLLTGPNPVLDRLPRAQLFLDGFEWILDEETGGIVSSFYRSRYQLHVTPSDRARQQRWGEMRKQQEGV